MPVLVTGAEGGLGAATAERLLASGGEVRVWLDAERSADDDARVWRTRGCKAALGTSDDEGRLEAALEQVHTVVHTAGGPLEHPGAATDAMATLVSAVLGAGCRRIVWVTDLALAALDDLRRPPPYVAALAERAGLLADLPMDVVVIRTALRYGPGDQLTQLLAAAGRGALSGGADDAAPVGSEILDRGMSGGRVPGAGLSDAGLSEAGLSSGGLSDGGLRGTAVAHAPVWIGDVAGAVVAADAQRGAIADVHVEVDLVGPTVVPLGAVVDALAAVVPPAPPPAGMPPAGLQPEVAPRDGVPWRDVVSWLRIPAVGPPEALGRSGTGFPDGIRMLSQRENRHG